VELGRRVPLLGTPKYMLSKALEKGVCFHRDPFFGNMWGGTLLSYGLRVTVFFFAINPSATEGIKTHTVSADGGVLNSRRRNCNHRFKKNQYSQTNDPIF
jgi:hypothetical protein